jgi:hypothetical protein
VSGKPRMTLRWTVIGHVSKRQHERNAQPSKF